MYNCFKLAYQHAIEAAANREYKREQYQSIKS